MKKILLLAAVIAAVVTMGMGFGYTQTSGSTSPQGGWYCPWYNQANVQESAQKAGGWYCPWMGSGYQGQHHGMRYGRMGHGGCMGQGWGHRNWNPGDQAYQNPGTQSQSQ